MITSINPMEVRLNGSQENITQVLSIQPMPAGIFTTAHTEADATYPETISMVNTVLFMAICKVAGSDALIECFGVQDPIDHTIIWYSNDQAPLYAYGPYVATCKLIGESPRSFVEWYRDRKESISEFDIKLGVTRDSVNTKPSKSIDIDDFDVSLIG